MLLCKLKFIYNIIRPYEIGFLVNPLINCLLALPNASPIPKVKICFIWIFIFSWLLQVSIGPELQTAGTS